MSVLVQNNFYPHIASLSQVSLDLKCKIMPRGHTLHRGPRGEVALGQALTFLNLEHLGSFLSHASPFPLKTTTILSENKLFLPELTPRPWYVAEA